MSLSLINLESTNLQEAKEHGDRTRNLITRFLQQTNFEGGRKGEMEERIRKKRESNEIRERGKGRRQRKRETHTETEEGREEGITSLERHYQPSAMYEPYLDPDANKL